METPLQLQIQGFELSSHLRDVVDANVAKLEEHYGRITSCRIAIAAPGAHHRMGEAYAVSIRIALPNGNEVNVGRISGRADRRQADVTFAVHDAFRRAARQLRDRVRRLEGKVKADVRQPEARVLELDRSRNCGFLVTEDGREIYFHANSVLGPHFDRMQSGDRVSYHEEMGEKGPQASTVRLLGASARR